MRSNPGARRAVAGRWLAVAVGLCLCGACLGACDRARPRAAATADSASNQERAWQAVAAGALLVDVRTAEEFADGHLPGAVHIPYQEVAERLPGLAPDTSRTIVLYCRSGRRSGIATRQLRSLGYGHLIDGGGLEEMQAARPVAEPAR